MANAGVISVSLQADGTAKFSANMADVVKALKEAKGAAAESATGFDAFKKALGEAASGAKMIVGIGAAFAAAVGAAAVASAKLGNMASDYNEMTNVLEQAFGKDRVAAIESWSAKTGEAMGRSTSDIRNYAGGLQAMLAPMMGSAKAAEPMSMAFAQLAVDLGSFWNISDNDALAKLRSGLVGETEPLRSLGIVMTEASLQAYALKNGVRVLLENMSESEKVTLRYNFILEQTSQAHGDAVRTADGYANTLKSVQGNLSNMATEMGQQALPFMKDMIKTFDEMISVFKGFDATEYFRTLGATIKTAADMLLAMSINALKLFDTLKGFHPLVMMFKAFGGTVGNMEEEIQKLTEARAALNGERHGPIDRLTLGQNLSLFTPQEEANRTAEEGRSKGVDDIISRDAGLSSITGKATKLGKDAAPNMDWEHSSIPEFIQDIEDRAKYREAKEEEWLQTQKKIEAEGARFFHDTEEGKRKDIERTYEKKKALESGTTKTDASVIAMMGAGSDSDFTLAKRAEAMSGHSMGQQLAGQHAFVGADGTMSGASGLGGGTAAQALGSGFDALLSSGSVVGSLAAGLTTLLGSAAAPLVSAAGAVGGAMVKMAEQAFQMLGDAWKATGGAVLDKMLGSGNLKGSLDQVGGTFAAAMGGLAVLFGGLGIALGVVMAPLGSIAVMLSLMFPVLVMLIAPLAAMGVVVAALVGALMIVTAGVVAAGMGMFELSTKTRSFDLFSKAMEGATQRIVYALEPFFRQLMPLAGLFDMLVQVIIPLAQSFAGLSGFAGNMFYLFKDGALVIGAFFLAVGMLDSVVLSAVEGLATAFANILDACGFLQDGMNRNADAMLAAGKFMVDAIQAVFGWMLSQSMNDALKTMSDGLGAQIGSGAASQDLSAGLRGIASTAHASQPNIAGMATALQQLAGVSADEAAQRAQSLALEKDAADSMANVPSGYKVALARFQNITDASGAYGADSAHNGAGNTTEGAGIHGAATFNIESMTVVANDPDQLNRQIQMAAGRRNMAMTGRTTQRTDYRYHGP